MSAVISSSPDAFFGFSSSMAFLTSSVVYSLSSAVCFVLLIALWFVYGNLYHQYHRLLELVVRPSFSLFLLDLS